MNDAILLNHRYIAYEIIYLCINAPRRINVSRIGAAVMRHENLNPLEIRAAP